MTRKRILLAEDDDALRASLCFVLRSGGYEVLEAAEGQAALDLLLQERQAGRSVEMLLTDIRMPGMSGVDLLKLLPEAGLDLPTVVISGHGDRELLVDLLRLGCADFLPKPFEPVEVLEKVAEVLGKVARKGRLDSSASSMRDKTVLLDRDAEAARRDMELLRREVDTAAKAYREIMETGNVLPMETALRNCTYHDLGGDYAGTYCSGSICDLLVADVAGHDLAASYQTILVKSFFDENCRIGGTGATLLARLNEQLHENERNERMVTAMFVRLDLGRGRGEVVSAGHPDLLLHRAGAGEAELLPARGDVLGLHREVAFESVFFDIASGDRLFLYTDGLTGASHTDGPSGEKRVLAASGFKGLVERFAARPLELQVDSVWKDVLGFSRGKIMDDMLLFGVEIP